MSKKTKTSNTGVVNYTYSNSTSVNVNYTSTSTTPPTFDYEEQRSKLVEHLNYKRDMEVQTSTLYDKYLEITTTYTEDDLPYLNQLREKLWKPTNINNVDLTIKELNDLEPVLEVVEDDKLKKEWNHIRRMISSASYSKGVGRGIKFYMLDKRTKKILGIAELSSDFGSMGVRDNFIGWTKDNRYKDKKLNNTAVGSTIVATQPFGHNFLGGKLLCMLLTSDYVRKVWKDKYGDELVGLTTTSLKGHRNTGSMYSGLGKYWKSLGHTTGSMSIIPDDKVYKPITKWLKETFKKEYDAAMSKSGPKQKVMSLIFKKFGLRQKDFKRGFKRGVYFSSFYKETKEYLQGKEVNNLTNRFDSDTESLVEVWRQRSIKRYLKLVGSGRLSSEDLFYTNYLTEETNNIQSKPKVLEVVCKPITKVYDEVIINHNYKSVNYKSQHKSIISSLYHKSFIRTNYKPMIL